MLFCFTNSNGYCFYFLTCVVAGLNNIKPSTRPIIVLPNAWVVARGDVEPLYFFGFIPIVGYQASVIPAFISGILGAKLKKRVRKFVPDTLDLIVTPFLTLFVMIIVTLFFIGPVFRSVEGGIVTAVVALLDWPLGIGGALIGFSIKLSL